MEGAAKAAMAAGCTVFKPVFTPANLALLEAFMLVTALVTMLLTTSSDTTEASTEAPVINLVAGAALMWLAKELAKEGAIPAPTLVQLCMGVPWGAPDDLNTFMAMVNNVPSDWHWSAFAIGRNQMPYVAASVLAGGNVRVGLEDNLWLDKGVLATNAQLVERAVSIISNLGARVITPAEVRAKLKLEKRAPMGK